MKKLTWPALVFLLFADAEAQNKKPIVASDLMKIATASQVQIAPDGTKAVAIITRKAVKNDHEYYYTRHLYLVDIVGRAEPRQLTFGDRNDSAPQWSPDGKHVAFVRTEDEKSQIWCLPMSGGEAFVLTKAKNGASHPRWSPDGKKVLYISMVPHSAIEGRTPWIYERPGRQYGDEPNFRGMTPEEKKKVSAGPDGPLADVRSWLAKNASENNPRVLNRLDLQAELNLQPEESYSHLFVKSFGDEEKEVQLTTGFQDFANSEWSPDGKTIVCDSKKYDVHPDRERDADIWTINVETGEAQTLLKWAGYSLGSPTFSPDGSMIAFNANTIDGRFYSQSLLATATASGANPTVLTRAVDRDVSTGIWAPDGKGIYFTAQSEGDVCLYVVPARGGAVNKLVGNDSGVNDFDVTANGIVFALTETANPWELHLLNLKDKSTRQLTRLNEGWVKEKQIVFPKEFTFTRPDGIKIQYWVMEPLSRKDGQKYPTILNIHGGPSAMWGPGIFSMWHEYQLENSWGYGIVYCNPRGSGGYGDKFKRANYKDWGAGPAGDILASLDEAMRNNPWIDGDQLFVEGGSYAGYMVAWIIGHDHRFKAANAQRGVYELSTFMGEGNAWRLIPEHFGGYPWEGQTKELLDANSPLTYVHSMNTPLLIIHGDQDLRTGVIQSETLYKSLKILGKPVEYIRYPKEGHELTRSGNPGRMMDHLLRVIEFFERYARHPSLPPAVKGTE